MKKKYITGLLMMAVSAMLFTGCGFSIGKEIPVKDLIAGASQDSDKMEMIMKMSKIPGQVLHMKLTAGIRSRLGSAAGIP